MNFILNIFIILSFILGIYTVLITNKPPYYIVKIPNLNDTYKDENNNIYKYRLKYIS